MRFLKGIYRFIMMTLIVAILLSPFLLGFFLKLLATGFYSGLEQAENFLNRY